MEANRRLLRSLIIYLLIALVASLGLLGLTAVVTRTPEGNSVGFPLSWSSPNSPCATPTPFNGCGFTYSPAMTVLDFLFWAVLVFAFQLLFHSIRVRSGRAKDLAFR